jgi:DNA-binding MarR family transcriptional regulator
MTWQHIDEETENAYLAHFARRLSDLIISQATEMLSGYGLRMPSSSVSTALFLWKAKQATVTEISTAFDYTHQMAVQRIKGLEDLGLVERVINENDRRSRLIRLTKSGLIEAEQLAFITKQAAAVFDELYNEIDCNLTTMIMRAEKNLKITTLAARMKKRAKSGEKLK